MAWKILSVFSFILFLFFFAGVLSFTVEFLLRSAVLEHNNNRKFCGSHDCDAFFFNFLTKPHCVNNHDEYNTKMLTGFKIISADRSLIWAAEWKRNTNEELFKF